ncbi:MAG: nucleoside kinase [Bacteroidales bacterium]|nr:nucleoside kinase [Bacteroidales bacterium]
MVEITCKNTKETKSFLKGLSLQQLHEAFGKPLGDTVIAAVANNSLRELDYEVFKPKIIEFIDLHHPLAKRMCSRSAIFVLYKAIRDLFPEANLRVEHSLPGGVYCEIDNLPFQISQDMAHALEVKTHEIIKANLLFRRQQIPTEEAVELFKKHRLFDKVNSIETRHEFFTSVYFLDDEVNYFYGYLLPSTGYLPYLEFELYGNGFLMKTSFSIEPGTQPKVEPDSKLFKIFRQYKGWLDVLNLRYIGDLNHLIEQKTDGDIIKIAEALQEKNIAHIADEIYNRKEAKMVLISGPSSSGKTTFSKRLDVQLQVMGLTPVVIELDNYFKNREDTPRDENGDYDFETIDALDVDFFNEQLVELLDGKEIQSPTFNFYTGQREFRGNTLQMKERSILVMEGIHGNNPKLTARISDKLKYRIYVSALTPISIDAHNPIPTTDNRLIRRIVRDYRTRGYSAIDTINRWNSVRRGEEKNIFPFQEEADVIFNSALIFELSVLKTFAEPILRAVPETSEAYNDATGLLKFFTYFQPMSDREIPPTSILREFLGGSSFIY